MLEILLPSLNDGNNCKTLLGAAPRRPQLFLEGAALIRQRLASLGFSPVCNNIFPTTNPCRIFVTSVIGPESKSLHFLHLKRIATFSNVFSNEKRNPDEQLVYFFCLNLGGLKVLTKNEKYLSLFKQVTDLSNNLFPVEMFWVQ